MYSKPRYRAETMNIRILHSRKTTAPTVYLSCNQTSTKGNLTPNTNYIEINIPEIMDTI